MIDSLKNGYAARFLTVGSLTFLSEYIVFYILFIFLKWGLLLANSLSFGIGLSMSFMLNRKWAFKAQEYQHKVHHQAAIYALLAITNLVFNNLIVAGLNSGGIDPRIGKVIAIATIAVWNFLIYKHFIFKSKQSATES